MPGTIDFYCTQKNVGLSGETFGLSKDELQVQDFMELVEPAGGKGTCLLCIIICGKSMPL